MTREEKIAYVKSYPRAGMPGLGETFGRQVTGLRDEFKDFPGDDRPDLDYAEDVLEAFSEKNTSYLLVGSGDWVLIYAGDGCGLHGSDFEQWSEVTQDRLVNLLHDLDDTCAKLVAAHEKFLTSVDPQD